ncbi:bifunctional metallophosphatase/5'-nucleotidase [Luteimonas vadosa]|uniref:Bifunctional metallophosphatase/5'-nucleotidase n=1 Tax=Luteimonas vadosa TaxID=1165507 RepID=A0ABP9E4D5_9GAMM
MDLRLLHMGDIHGHLLPRPHLRGDGPGMQGGLAHLYTLVERLRGEHPGTLLFNTGDTIQGSAEALFTRGQALVDVLDRFGIDAFAPGNWDYLYGKARFLELFGPGSAGEGGCRWGAVAANAYDDSSGGLLLPAYRMLAVGPCRIAVLGLSSDRAINALGPWVTEGIRFTSTADELGPLLAAIAEDEQPDLVVLLSEFGLAKNLLIAERYPQLAVVLSSDMHEETRDPVRTSTGALVSEVGQDGTRLGQFDLRIEGGRVVDWTYHLHVVDEALAPDGEIAAAIDAARRPFVSGPAFTPHVNPLNGATLATPIDTVVGQAHVGLHRSGFTHDPVPAAVQGTSSQYLAEAFRRQAGADVGHMRGFRYGTHVPVGPIRLEDLYHYMPVGPQLAVGRVTGRQLVDAVERSADGVFNPDPFKWTGGWLDAYAGLRFSLDVAGKKGHRTAGHRVQRHGDAGWSDLDFEARYRVAGYWYAREPRRVGGLETETAEVLATTDGGVRDAVDWVTEDLAGNPADPMMDTVQRVGNLPAPRHGNPELQPLAGATRKHADDS